MRRHRIRLALIGLLAGCCILLITVSALAEDKPAPAASSDSPEAKSAAPAEKAESAGQGKEAKTSEGEKKEEGKTEEGKSTPANTKWIDGSLQLGADSRWADGHSDVDLDQTLRFNITPPNYPKLHLRGLIWTYEDLASDEPKNSVLRDINDGYDSSARLRPLSLYVEIDDVWGKSELRIGRQRIQEGAAFNRIDGVYFKQNDGALDWYAFAGARASVYRDTHDDAAFGGGVAYRFGDKTRVALDAYYGDEDRLDKYEVYRGVVPWLLDDAFPRRVKEEVGDNLFALSVWQEITPNLRAFGKFTLHNGESNEFLLNLTGYAPSWNLSYDATYRRQLDTIEDRVSDLMGFYRILGPYEPYDSILLGAHRPLTDKLTLSAEVERHNSRGDNEYTANRDYTRYAVILGADKLAHGLGATMSLARWDVDRGEGSWVVTGEVSKTWGKAKLTLGADYQQYKDEYVRYNPNFLWARKIATRIVPGFYPNYMPLVSIYDTGHVTTVEDVHTLYTKLKWAVCASQDLTTQISYEDDDGPESPYWRARVTYEIRF